ncbi:MAG: ParB/RepB/Spo0J family partition protein [Minwuiales bacterium]|nr:ParB/RepB/Spo0J family partition protein [Minwuiales bacterium]
MSDEGPSKKGLGRGLAALLGDDPAEDLASLDRVRATKDVPVEQLRPGPYQPRRLFNEEQLDSLVQSVKERGILQPILVRRSPTDSTEYEIVAGERRWRAAQLARLHRVPVIIKELTDKDSLEIALVENIQRQDLSPLEESQGYKRLLDEFSYTQEQLGHAIGKSRSHIANMVRLLSLPDEVQEMLDDGRLSAGAARALITAEDPVKLAREIVSRGLNVRDAEKIRQRASKPKQAAPEKDADTQALEDSLEAALGLKVAIKHRGDRGGDVRIAYKSLEQLDEICRRLSRPSGLPEDGGEDDLLAFEDTAPFDAAAAVAEDLAALQDDIETETISDMPQEIHSAIEKS